MCISLPLYFASKTYFEDYRNCWRIEAGRPVGSFIDIFDVKHIFGEGSKGVSPFIPSFRINHKVV